MNKSVKVTYEAISKIFNASKKQFDCAAKFLLNLKENEEALCNAALYHLSESVRIGLRITCLRFSIEYADGDSIEDLFNKIGQYLPPHILDIKQDIYFWQNDVQNHSDNVMSTAAAIEFARTIEKYFNDYICVYSREMKTNVTGMTLFAVNIKPLSKF